MRVISLRNCNRALVYGTDKKPLSEARVLDTGSNVYMFLSNTKLHPALIRVFVDFYKDAQGVIRCWCELKIRKNQQIGNSQEIWLAECNVLEIVKTIQRQKNLRVQINTPIIYATDNKPIARGTIKNISAGGICLNTSEIMKNGTRITYEHILDGILCEVKAQVIYGRVDTETHKYGYGCNFIDLSDETARTIRLWCHNHQERKLSA